MELHEELEAAHEKCLLGLNGSLHKEGPPLYHYTSISSCLSIIETGKLFLTDVRYLNDPNEISNGLEIFNSAYNELASEFTSKSQKYFLKFINIIRIGLNVTLSFRSEGEKFLSALTSKEEDIELKKYAEIFSPKNKPENKNIYIASFSEDKDNLRQWMPYASDGKGLSIGFEGISNNMHAICQYDIIKVCYETDDNKKNYVKNLLKDLFLIFDRCAREGTLSTNQDLFIDSFWIAFMFDIIACKTPEYKDEKEWRLVVVTTQESEKGRIKYRVTQDIIKPYLEISIEKKSIKEIILGPKAENTLNQNSLQSVLHHKEYKDVHIGTSVIKYR